MARLTHLVLCILGMRHADWRPYWDTEAMKVRSRRWQDGAWETREATEAEKDDMADQQTW